MSPFINPNVFDSFAGLAMQQSWSDLVLWEWFLNRVQIRSILELGTGTGAFSCFLLSQCVSRSLSFATIDIYEPEWKSLHKYLKLPAVFRQIDLAKPNAKKEIASIMADLPRPVVLYCDNGDKPHEVAMFHNLLHRGDYIGVHDFGVEFHEHDLEPIRNRVVELIKPEEEVCRTRFYEVIK